MFIQLNFFIILTKSVFFFLNWVRVSLCCPGCPGTHYVDKAWPITNRDSPASVSWVLELCTTMPGLSQCFVFFLKHNEHYGNGMWDGLPWCSWEAYYCVSEVYSCIPMVVPLPFYLVNGVCKKCGSVVSYNSILYIRNVERFGKWTTT